MNDLTRLKNDDNLRQWHQRKEAMRARWFHDWAPAERRYKYPWLPFIVLAIFIVAIQWMATT